MSGPTTCHSLQTTCIIIISFVSSSSNGCTLAGGARTVVRELQERVPVLMCVVTFCAVPVHRHTVKFITDTRTKTNDQHEYGYRYLVPKTIKYGYPYSSALFHSVRVSVLYHVPFNNRQLGLLIFARWYTILCYKVNQNWVYVQMGLVFVKNRVHWNMWAVKHSDLIYSYFRPPCTLTTTTKCSLAEAQNLPADQCDRLIFITMKL